MECVNILEDNSDQEGTREVTRREQGIHETRLEGTNNHRCPWGRVSTETITLGTGVGQSEEHNVGLYPWIKAGEWGMGVKGQRSG